MSTSQIFKADHQILLRVVRLLQYALTNFNFDIKMFSKQNIKRYKLRKCRSRLVKQTIFCCM